MKRTLYKLRQAPRAWHTCLKEELGKFEFVVSMADAALFTALMNGERVHFTGWINDILVVAQGVERIAKVRTHLAKKFNVCDLGETTYFFAMEVLRNQEARTPKPTRKKLAGELLGRHGLASARARSVLSVAGEEVNEGGEADWHSNIPSSEVIGSLILECLHSAEHCTGRESICELHKRADGSGQRRVESCAIWQGP